MKTEPSEVFVQDNGNMEFVKRQKRNPPMRQIRVHLRPPDIVNHGDRISIGYPGEPGVTFKFADSQARENFESVMIRACSRHAPSLWERLCGRFFDGRELRRDHP